MTAATDWVAWHQAYDREGSPLALRLTLVRGHLSDALSAAPAGPISVVSLCAGQGHDVLGVLPGHPRRADVAAVLVEADPRNVVIARQRAATAGLSPAVDVRQANAGQLAAYLDALPADVLLLCGIFGNVSDLDVSRMVRAAAAMCKPAGTVIWTRHRREPDLTPQIRALFADAGFEEIAFEAPPGATITGVGVHRLRVRPSGVRLPEGRLFTFMP
jgi:hypothetical protein